MINRDEYIEICDEVRQNYGEVAAVVANIERGKTYPPLPNNQKAIRVGQLFAQNFNIPIMSLYKKMGMLDKGEYPPIEEVI